MRRESPPRVAGLQHFCELRHPATVVNLDDDLRIVELFWLGASEYQKRGPLPPTKVVSDFKR